MTSIWYLRRNVFYVDERLFNWTEPSWVEKLGVRLNFVHLQSLMCLIVDVLIDTDFKEIKFEFNWILVVYIRAVLTRTMPEPK